MRRVLLVALLALAACASQPRQPPVQTVAQVDIERYMGRWYEIARFPNSFQDGRGRRCIGTTAGYALRPDGQVTVTNRCLDAADGDKPVIAEGSAYAVEGTGNAKLRVSFFWPFYGDYWVIGLDPAYRWAVVGAPDRDYLWILSRTPELPAAEYAEAVGIAAAQGFDASRLQPTPQPPRQAAP
jgi:apolipoprotein D and lipocalin family protein